VIKSPKSKGLRGKTSTQSETGQFTTRTIWHNERKIMTPEEIEELVDDLYTQFEELTRNTVAAAKTNSDTDISPFGHTFMKVMDGLYGRFEWAHEEIMKAYREEKRERLKSQ
jgi:hypothetical protein